MRILPILFNTEMVRALQVDMKTATRRVIKPQPPIDFRYPQADDFKSCWWWTDKDGDDDMMRWWPSYENGLIPPYEPGDILYVRETWAESAEGYAYKADFDGAEGWGWRPSIHMPKEAARIFLRVTDVRVERLQEITEDGVIAEGVKPSGGNFALDDFEPLWDSTIKPADRALYGWDANPWVWIIEFERTDKPEGWPHGKA